MCTLAVTEEGCCDLLANRIDNACLLKPITRPGLTE